MTIVSSSTTINAPVAKVFNFLTAVENHKQWQPSLLEASVTPAGPIAVGLLTGLAKMLVVGQALALLDGSIAKFRLLRVPDLLGLASLLALTGLAMRMLLP